MKLIALDGNVYDAIPVMPNKVGRDNKCHDCAQPVGSDHIPGCDVERCPRCHGQMISCGCECDERPSWSLLEMRELISHLTVVLNQTDHTAEIQRRLDEAFKQGGGIVYVPKKPE